MERVVGDNRTIGSAEDLTIWYVVRCLKKGTTVSPLYRRTLVVLCFLDSHGPEWINAPKEDDFFAARPRLCLVV